MCAVVVMGGLLCVLLGGLFTACEWHVRCVLGVVMGLFACAGLLTVALSSCLK